MQQSGGTLFQAFFFLFKAQCLHYPQHILTADNSVGDSGGSSSSVCSFKPQAEMSSMLQRSGKLHSPRLFSPSNPTNAHFTQLPLEPQKSLYNFFSTDVVVFPKTCKQTFMWEKIVEFPPLRSKPDLVIILISTSHYSNHSSTKVTLNLWSNQSE